jgi:hypothetical protein
MIMYGNRKLLWPTSNYCHLTRQERLKKSIKDFRIASDPLQIRRGYIT